MIEKNRLLTLFENLISIDSPTLGERAICDFLTQKLRALGASVWEDDAGQALGGTSGNLYAYIDGTEDLPPLLFCAHMDTVEPGRGKRMQTDENGVITSVGDTILGADDCAGLAAILEGLTALVESGLPHRPVEVLFTVSEEVYCAGVRHFDASRLRSREAYVFDLTGPVGGAAVSAPTIFAFEAAFTGRAAHAGFEPEAGIHAIRAAGLAVSRIPCGRQGEGTVNIGTIRGGTANNIVPDSCTLTGEIRNSSDEAARAHLLRIEQICQDAAGECGASLAFKSDCPCVAYHTDPGHSVVRRFESACREHGLSAQLCGTFGGSDNNHLSQQGISGIVLATAMNNCHSCEEFTTKQELCRIAHLALSLMRSQE